MTTADDDELVGVTIRRGLRLDAVLARGGFGTVYRAQQIDVDRAVAVKVLHRDFDPDDEAGRLFRDEIRAIGTLDHRNVVRILDAGVTTGDRLYFAMELLAGRTLQQLAEAGPVPAPRAIALAAQLLRGLAAVHAAGHIHADVKPSNALVVDDEAGERVVLIDFGLTRLRATDGAAEAVGGTRAYMAPEQLAAWQVSPRSDVFAAALVLVRLLTGWERAGADDLVPPLDAIDDAAVRTALARALAIDPDQRPSAIDFARALAGGDPDQPAAAGPPPPFRHLVPLTEHDRGRLHGREADVVALARQLEAGRPVVVAAPSGTGKTSLLRAGLVPYLDASGTPSRYVGDRDDARACLAALDGHRGRMIIVLDQVEAWLGDAALDALIDARADVAIVLGVREDFVARVVAASPVLARGVPLVRLGPLDRGGARAALLGPFAEHGVALTPALVTALLDDLGRAGRALGASLGWGDGDAIYPPHLQLIGEALWRQRGPRDAALTLAHYHRLGGLDAILADDLDRKLAALSLDERAIARELFVTLVASAQTRAVRGEAELIDRVGPRRGDDAVRRVLTQLGDHRLIVRRGGVDGAATWELVHDSLVPRIEAWLTVQDLDRRRAAEWVRLHLRESRVDAPALLTARQLRAVDDCGGLADELDAEWARRADAAWTPRRLIARSRHVVRVRRAAIAGAVVIALATTAILAERWRDERARRAHEESLRDRDLGRVTLALAPFEWQRDPATGAQVAVALDPTALPALTWTLHDPSPDDPDGPGPPIAAARVQRGAVRFADGARVEELEARGGDAFVLIDGRGRDGERCPPSIVPLRRLPGYARRLGPRPLIRLAVPTCAATRFDTIAIPAGRFVLGGAGVPPLPSREYGEPPREHTIELDGFRIDRTEITNGGFAAFAAMTSVHDVRADSYPSELAVASGATFARGGIDWFDARAYCRFLGKELPTSAQWQKAFRGGLIVDGQPNPAPRRNLPWITPRTPSPTAIDRDVPAAVASHPDDVSPYGVLDLAGNLQEWTDDVEREGDPETPTLRRPRLTRGANWDNTTEELLLVFLAVENARPPRSRSFVNGARCAITDRPTPRR